MWHTIIAIVVSAFLFGSCGDGGHCKDACDKVKACGLKTSGLSCDDTCKEPSATCADCIDVTSCDDIAGGSCSSECPGVAF